MGRGFRRRAKPAFRVRRWVKRYVNKTRETKILPILGTAFTLNSGITRVFNPTYQIGQGDGSGERVGRKIQQAFCVLGMEATMTADGSTFPGVNSQNAYMRLLVLTSRAVKFGAVGVVPTANPAGIGPIDIFYFPNNPVTSQVDKNKWTVVRDMVFVSRRFIQPTAGDPSGPVVIRKRIRVPLPKLITYRDDGAANSTLTGSETYIVLVGDYYTSAVSGDPVYTVTLHGTIHFKDA